MAPPLKLPSGDPAYTGSDFDAFIETMNKDAFARTLPGRVGIVQQGTYGPFQRAADEASSLEAIQRDALRQIKGKVPLERYTSEGGKTTKVDNPWGLRSTGFVRESGTTNEEELYQKADKVLPVLQDIGEKHGFAPALMEKFARDAGVGVLTKDVLEDAYLRRTGKNMLKRVLAGEEGAKLPHQSKTLGKGFWPGSAAAATGGPIESATSAGDRRIQGMLAQVLLNRLHPGKSQYGGNQSLEEYYRGLDPNRMLQPGDVGHYSTSPEGKAAAGKRWWEDWESPVGRNRTPGTGFGPY
jgi:hypothetical protein